MDNNGFMINLGNIYLYYLKKVKQNKGVDAYKIEFNQKLLLVITPYSLIFIDKSRKLSNSFSKYSGVELKPSKINQLTFIPPYKLSKNDINDLLNRGYLRKSLNENAVKAAEISNSNYLIDYEHLNSWTAENDKLKIVNRRDILSQIRPSGLFTKLKIKDALNQIRLHESSIELTAFELPDTKEKYEFLCLFRCLKQSADYLQTAIDDAVFNYFIDPELFDFKNYNFFKLNNENLNNSREILNNSVKIYLDEILIYTGFDELDSHLFMIELILFRLGAYFFKIDLDQSIFLTSYCKFIDRNITVDGISIGSNYLERINQFKLPKESENLMDFLELIDEFREYSNINKTQLNRLSMELEFMAYLNDFNKDENFIKKFNLIKDSFKLKTIKFNNSIN